MRPTLADVARETGLTLGTVSRALAAEGKYAVAPETRERVLATATRLGYRPNLIGKALASGSAALVLLISPDPFAPYYVEISRHLSSRASGEGYTFVSGGTRPEVGASGIPANDWLYGVDGMVVCDYLPYQEAYIVEALRLRIPIVGLGLRHPFPTDTVGVDLSGAARELMAHLFEPGGSVAMIRTPGTGPDDPRLATYLETCREREEPARVISATSQSRSAGREAASAAYAEMPFDALFCENDVLASGAYRGLLDLGAGVPGNVRLAGCDGLDDSAYAATPITTLVQPLEAMASRAWTMLRERIEGEGGAPRTETFAARLEIRASTQSLQRD